MARLALLGVLLLAAGLVWAAYGPHAIDDAYITFRYSRNLAEGRGLVYNPGERVQGSSTPLWSVSLGLLGAAGISIPAAGVGLGFLCGLGTLLLLIGAGRQLGEELAGWAAAFALTFQFFWVVLWVSGMETMLFSGLTLALLLKAARENWRGAGALAGLVCLVRYDGAIAAVAVFLVMLWRAGWRRTLVECLWAIGVYLPWMIFAAWYFGSPIPQTILAKKVINVISWREAFRQCAVYWQYSPEMWVWAPLAAWGAIRAVRNGRAWAVFPLWIAMDLCAYIAQRRPVTHYPWYWVPLFPAVFLLGGRGLRDVLGCVGLIPAAGETAVSPNALRAWRAGAIAAIPILFGAGALMIKVPDYGASTLHRERKYQRAAEALAPRLRPGQTIYMGEVGTMGWFLPDARILDSAGLLSPEIYRIRKWDREALARRGRRPEQDPDGSADVTRKVIEELRPDFITAGRSFLFMKEIKDEPDFREQYEEIEGEALGPLDQWAFRRIAASGQAAGPKAAGPEKAPNHSRSLSPPTQFP